jgi:hypothetical protein
MLKASGSRLGVEGRFRPGYYRTISYNSWGSVRHMILAFCSFYDEREASADWDERDVVERVGRQEYDAGAVSQRTMEVLQAEGTAAPDGLRIIWSSPGYSHCCFTAHSDMDPVLTQKITQTFVAIDARDPAGKAVLAGCGKSRDFGKTVMKRARNGSPGLIKSTGYEGAKGDESGWKHHRPTFSAAC